MLYVKVMNVISKIAAVLSVISLVASALLTFVDVLLRWIFDKPITGATEWVQCLWILLGTAFALTTMSNEHTKVDVLTSKMPVKVVKVINMVMNLACVVFSGFMIYGTIDNVLYSKSCFVTLWQSGIPEWIPMLVYAISLIILALATVGIIIVEWKGYNTADQAIAALKKGKEGKAE